MTPAITLKKIVEEAIDKGIKVVTIFSNGFSEEGAQGRKLQSEIVEISRTSDVRILGPNCMGIINIHDKVALSSNAVLEGIRLIEGRI